MPNDKEFELDDLESFSFDDLSLEEDPPSAEPASGEDPFGVWVKSAPEDVPPVSDDTLPEDDFLSSEELANLDDSFDFVTVSDEPLEGETPLEDEIAFLDAPEALAAEQAAGPVAASFDEVSLDDFVSFDDVPIEDVPEFVTEPQTASETSSFEEDLNEEFLDIDIDIEDDIGDEELEIIEGATPRASEEAEVSLESFSAQEVDLSEFGDFEEVTPMAGPLAGAEDLPEVMDLPEMPVLSDDIELPEDLDLPQDLALSDEADTIALSDLSEPEEGFFEETILQDPLPSLVDEGPVSLDLEPDDQTDLDHIMALEEDLTSGIREPEAEAAPVASNQPSSDLAALILAKIEQELSSIKQEISELKTEVSHLRTAPVPQASDVVPAPEALEPEVEPEPEMVPEPEVKPHGFFDEEDDETIALTGDELDNILSTAEISEGEEPGLSLDDDLLGMDAEGNLLDPLPEIVSLEEPHDELHVTDEEFLAGTALDLNEPDPLAEDAQELGIPDSIELEEEFPLDIEEGLTEDLLAGADLTEDLDGTEEFDVPPLPEGLLEGAPEPLEIPFDDDIGLELEDMAPLVPELEMPLTEVPLEEAEVLSLPADPASDGWSPSALPALEPVQEEMESDLDLELEEVEPVPAFEAPLPPTIPVAQGATIGSLSPGLKDELKAVLQYMDKLLASLPDDKIQEFAESEHFEVYKKLFEELGLIE